MVTDRVRICTGTPDSPAPPLTTVERLAFLPTWKRLLTAVRCSSQDAVRDSSTRAASSSASVGDCLYCDAAAAAAAVVLNASSIAAQHIATHTAASPSPSDVQVP